VAQPLVYARFTPADFASIGSAYKGEVLSKALRSSRLQLCSGYGKRRALFKLGFVHHASSRAVGSVAVRDCLRRRRVRDSSACDC